MRTPTPSSLSVMSSTRRYIRTPGWLVALFTVLALLAAHPVALPSSKGLARAVASPVTGTALSAGTVKAWGWNDRGQLGTGNPSFSHTPLPVHGLSDAVAIAAGERFALALRRDGTVWAWGQDEEAELGRLLTTCPYPSSSAVSPSTPCAAVPVRVPGLDQVVSIAASGSNALAVRADGTVWGWGDGFLLPLDVPACATDRGQFCVARPQRIPGLTHIVAIAASAGGDETGALALEADGTVWAWGPNDAPVNNPYINPRTLSRPDWAKSGARRLVALDAVVAIATNGDTSFVLRRDGTLWAWGRDDAGQRGDGRRVPQPQRMGDTYPPASRVAIRGRVIAVSAGYSTSGGYGMAVTADGALWIWGSGWDTSNADREYDTPMRVPMPVPATAVDATSADPTVVLGRDGSVWTWGDNYWGQLGIGRSGGQSTTPQRVRELGTARAIAAGWGFALAIESPSSSKAAVAPTKASDVPLAGW